MIPSIHDVFFTIFYSLHTLAAMCSITEPRRATVSCKNLFSSTANHDRSTPTTVPSSASRRHISNHSNNKRSMNNSNNNNYPWTRSSNQNIKQSQRTPDTHPHTNVFHIPFCVEPITDHGNKISTSTNSKLRTRLNPLSPAFFSTRHISLISDQKADVMSR